MGKIRSTQQKKAKIGLQVAEEKARKGSEKDSEIAAGRRNEEDTGLNFIKCKYSYILLMAYTKGQKSILSELELYLIEELWTQTFPIYATHSYC